MENKDIETCKLLYNTERVRLYVPEYGRNVQKMVDYLKTIEDREKRNEQARTVIKVMEIINPAVHLVAPKSIARSEGKAVRVIDKRKLI